MRKSSWFEKSKINIELFWLEFLLLVIASSIVSFFFSIGVLVVYLSIADRVVGIFRNFGL